MNLGTNFAPEGIAYDSKTKRVIYGEFGNETAGGKIRAVPYTSNVNAVELNSNADIEVLHHEMKYNQLVGIAVHPVSCCFTFMKAVSIMLNLIL